jgi:hypothetical protein
MPPPLRLALALAYACALLAPAVPVLAALLAPPPPLRAPEGGLAALGTLLDVGAAAGRARLVLLLTLLCVALAWGATLLAWWLTRRGEAGSAPMPSTGLWLWAPVPLSLLGLALGMVLGDLLLDQGLR